MITVRPPNRLLRNRAQRPQRHLLRQPHRARHDHHVQGQGHRQRDNHHQQSQHLPRGRQNHPRRGQVERQPPGLRHRKCKQLPRLHPEPFLLGRLVFQLVLLVMGPGEQLLSHIGEMLLCGFYFDLRHRILLSANVFVLSFCSRVLTHLLIGLPTSQRRQRPQDGRRAQER